ncbi:testis-specific serine/threonine-protein kinase 3-like [Hydractinia symbiolongicarpus]|uniref:testis-specific serine/threonine-protein kinase 3-like n=1 Tax=Hydractinia symbiolongicarpus TaxID=13093 RepID=UPI00254A04C1|nr:testis-specific serine/threonine-protein kinase 3-like [Hydractinia symbiolongicarpus]
MPEMTTNPDNSKKNEEDNSSGPASSAKEGGKERERPGTPKPSSVTTAGDSGQTSPKPPQPQTAFDSAAALLAQYGYGLGEQLGKGSYAIVRSASSKKHKRRVAIKIISKKKAPEDYLTKFLPREIQVLKRLRHSNCISLLEAIETNTRIYLIMNLAENGDLLEYIRERGPMPDDDARRYFRQLITATDYFHSLGIVHRDLKCENLLLDINHNIVVSDFGFARGQMINPETGKRRLSQTFCGSYAYAPPEILRGIAYDGTVADIWSLGVVLYTMVSASLPFDDSNLKTLLEQVMRQVHFSSRKKISPEVKDLICRMLQPSVEQRATVTEIREHCWFKGEKLPPTKPDEVSEEEGKN